MIWVGWRQQRIETLIAAGLVVVVAAVAVPVGLHMASVYTRDGLGACTGDFGPVSSCSASVPSFLSRFNGMNLLFAWATLLPALVALLLAAPFVLDLDSGTYRLFWTQSITRRRWIVTKLGMSAAVCVVAAGCLIALAMWSRAPLDRLDGRMSPNNYDAEGLVPIAYAVFVLGVAVALGAIWRRTVPSLLGAFAAYVVVRAFMDSWLREHLLTPVTTTWQASSAGPDLNRALVIDQFISNANGKELAPLGGGPCIQQRSGGGILGSHTSICAQPHAPGVHQYTTAIYQPASRFWELQSVEFAIVAGAGALLVLLAAWWTHRRVA
jgi:hypothetical protein